MSALPLSRRRWSLACGAWAATPARAGESTPPHPARLQALINPMGRISYLQDERAQGVVPELLRELARRSGVHIDVELLPRARLASLVQAGQGDLSVQARSRALEGLGNFVPFMRMRVMLVCHRAQMAQAPTDLATLIERSDWRGLIVRGAALGETLQGAVARLEAQRRLWLVRDWATVLRMLLARRAEFSLFTPTLLHAELAQMQPGYREQLAALPLADLPSHEVGLMVSQRVPAGLRERLVQQMKAMALDGTLRRLMLAEHPAELVAEDFQFFDNPSKRELR